MANAWKSMVFLLGVWTVAQTLVATSAQAAKLNPSFYNTSCPQLLPIVGLHVKQAIQNQSRVAASLLRLHFHDCFVQGCDASVLLDSTADHQSEKFAPPNNNSLTETAFDTIDIIKAAVEKACPNVVSCADIVALAAFFSVVLSGGPVWLEPLGRRDSLFSNFPEFVNLPSPNADLPTLKAKFANQSLTVDNLVALSGAHTIGLATCAAINTRLYDFAGNGGSDPTINATLLATLKRNCPNSPPGGNGSVTNRMDPVTPTVFDNQYYKNLLVGDGLFTSDEELYTAGNDTKKVVQKYAKNQSAWFSDFSKAMIKMGNLHPLTGKKGEIRKNCRVRNPASIVSVVDNDDDNERIELEPPHEEEQIEGETEDLDQFMRKVMTEILRSELEGLVEEL